MGVRTSTWWFWISSNVQQTKWEYGLCWRRFLWNSKMHGNVWIIIMWNVEISTFWRYYTLVFAFNRKGFYLNLKNNNQKTNCSRVHIKLYTFKNVSAFRINIFMCWSNQVLECRSNMNCSIDSSISANQIISGNDLFSKESCYSSFWLQIVSN